MRILRPFALLLFVALAVSMVAWQGLVIWDMAGLDRIDREPGGLILCIAVLALCAAEWALLRYAPKFVTTGLWVVTAPLRWVSAWFLRLVMGRGADIPRMWRAIQGLLALFALNVVLPLAVAGIVAPTAGAAAGLAAVLLQFFLFTDWHMGRALMHYFSSGASAFVSLRYLRKRPISLASVVGVAAGVGVLIVVNSIMNGFVKDYREQIRGSLSHVLLYFHSEAAASDEAETEAAAWRASVERLKSFPEAQAAWEHAKYVAYQAHLRGERLASYDIADVEAAKGGFPASRKWEPVEGVETPEFLQNLENPGAREFAGIGRGERLAFRLPVLLGIGPATPETILLRHLNPTGDKGEIEKKQVALRTDVRTALYVPRIMNGVAEVGKLAASHPDYAAHSPRIRNFGLISRTARSLSNPEDATMIVAVDPIQEPRISDLGEYAASAELQQFKARYLLETCVQLFDYLMVFESPDSGPRDQMLRAVWAAAPGSDSNPMAEEEEKETRPELPPFILKTPSGDYRLITYWSPADSTIRARRMVDEAHTFMWASLDSIRFRKGSPGADLYRIVRAAAKEIARSESQEALKGAADRMHRDLVAFADEWLAKSSIPLAEIEGSVAGQRGPQLGTYRGDDAAIWFFRERFLDGLSPLRRDITRELRESVVGGLRRIVERPEYQTSMPALAGEGIDAIEAALRPLWESELQSLDSVQSMIDATRRALDRVAEITRQPEVGDALGEAMRVARPFSVIMNEVLDAETFVGRLRANAERVRPTSSLMRDWDDYWSAVATRQEAYGKILPLRTRLLDGETASEYLARAKSILPWVPTENQVWKDSAAIVERARAAARSLLMEAFVPSRLDVNATSGRAGRAGIAESAARGWTGFKPLCEDLRMQVTAFVDARLPSLNTVAAIQSAIDSELLSAMRDLVTEATSELDPKLRANIELHLLPLTSEEVSIAYFQIRARTAGLLLGDTLARRTRSFPGSALNVYVLRQEHGRAGHAAFGQSYDQEFFVGGVYRSGIFSDNAQTMYTDFESYAAMLGETSATTLIGVKLKDYTPWDGRPHDLKESFEELIVNAMDKHREARNTTGSEDASSVFTLPFHQRIRVDVWELERAKLLRAVEREKTLLTLLLGLNMILAGIVILIVVYLTVVEKVKDIGILKALGASPWGIRSIFMFNALFIGVFGTLLGGVLGVLISQNLNAIEDWIDVTFGLKLFPPDIYYLTYVPSVKDWPLIELAISIGAPATVWAFFCGILPAVAASRKETVEALHYE